MKSIREAILATSDDKRQESVKQRLHETSSDDRAFWGAVIEGQVYDLYHSITKTQKIERTIGPEDEEAVILMRHSCAHLMAEAVQCLYPDTKLAIGPVINNGFYYDFYREEPFSTDDLASIEQKMRDLQKQPRAIERLVVDSKKLKKWYENSKEIYKLEILKDLQKQDATVTVYVQGEWFDMCRGPHVPNVKDIGTAFKLLNVAGSYWRGDSRNVMLQRIYGTCWFTDEQLQRYLVLQEEAKKHDHCLVGKNMELFHTDPRHPGVVFWHPHGWILYRTLQDYIRRRLKDDYEEVNTPIMLEQDLWIKSGHWDKFRTNMYQLPQEDKQTTMVLKPMNCPAHVQIYKSQVVSYRQLPMRLSEFGSCFRCEPSGALRGIMRLRNFVQDDAHIFCTQNQVVKEIKRFCQLLVSVYDDFGFTVKMVHFSNRPKDRVGDDEIWDRSEQALLQVLQELGLPYTINEGEGAFYGPKLEFCLLDALERVWQCGTVQLDFNLPSSLGAYFVDNDGSRQVPVMIHRAILGSMERFLGILLEHYLGFLPSWLAPRQVVIISINEDCKSYCQALLQELQALNIRAILDDREEKLSYKIREHTVKHVPMLFIVGNQEMDEDNVTIRWTKSQKITKMSRIQGIQLVCDECLPPDLRRLRETKKL